MRGRAGARGGAGRSEIVRDEMQVDRDHPSGLTDRAERTLLEDAWRAVAPAAEPPGPLSVTGAGGGLWSRLAVEETAVACVGAALLAAAELGRGRGAEPGEPSLDREGVTAAVRSERCFSLGGEAPGGLFAPLSRFWEAADGWVRTHANYPWHREALLRALGGADEDGVADAIAALPAEEVEARVFAAGGVAAAVRSAPAWDAHPQGRAVAAEPLVDGREIAGAAPRRRPPGALPASGVRVLDLTRVIAGPVCTRFLGALGADVLRLDPPARPDLSPGLPADTLLGKRSAFLDLTVAEDRAELEALLAAADVVVAGYRPGALERFGLGAEELAERHPGLVIVALDAWGWSGPWAGRRGFDSIVQAACGIAAAESSDGTTPGALPCQLLDHGTGYLAAAASLCALRRQEVEGGTLIRRLALARTARLLAGASERPDPAAPAHGAAAPTEPPSLVDLTGRAGPVEAVPPPGALAGRPLEWPQPVSLYGRDRAAWLPVT